MKASDEIRKLANEEIAKHSLRFFKTGKGEYGYSDIFLGVRAPKIRLIAKKYIDISIADMKILIQSKYHEERFLGLIILVNKYSKSKDKKTINQLYKIYISSFKYINNWDLVDTSAHKIVGAYIQQKPKAILKKLVRSKNMWERRIAVIATFQLIKMGRLKETFELSKMLLTDDHDLMHKAVGWMLREAGKKDIKKLEAFLKKNHAHMPRTMLRYSIEKFPEAKRKKYLKGIV